MPVEDKLIAMHARHAIAKTPLDISELVIACNRGVLEIYGKVKRPRNFVGQIDLNRELATLKQLARNTHGAKDLISDRLQVLE
jgi:hypothetical protein